MPRPRKSLIDLSTTPYYHVMSHCVQDAYLCGQDRKTGENYEHRRQWIVELAKFLSNCFSIDLCSYAVMENHYHLVLRVNTALILSDEEVVERWCGVYKSGKDKFRLSNLENPAQGKSQATTELIECWRSRLSDISWFMRALNERIARRANKESGRRGHFWGARFKSQALQNDLAVLSCMTYVDLNPVRAGIAKTLLDSNYTSIQERLKTLCRLAKGNVSMRSHDGNNRAVSKSLEVIGSANEKPNQPASLIALGMSKFVDGLSYSVLDYVKLVDWTGRQAHRRKRGKLSSQRPSLMEVLGVADDDWLLLSTYFEHRAKTFFRRFS